MKENNTTEGVARKIFFIDVGEMSKQDAIRTLEKYTGHKLPSFNWIPVAVGILMLTTSLSALLK
jgi:hypothetical protein